MKIIIVSLLICFLIALAAANTHSNHAGSNIQLNVLSQSTSKLLAVAVNNAGVGTQSVQIQQAQSSTWQSLTYQNAGYYSISSSKALKFPVSVRLTSVNGAQVTIHNAISSASVGVVNTGVSYGSSSDPASDSSSSYDEPTQSPTAPPKTKPTTAPTAQHATAAPTAQHATAKPTTAPTSHKATTAPTTAHKATTAPTTAPKAPTAAPSSGCSAGLKLMVPLYTYPGSSWDTVAAGAASVPTVAIINPNSGPGTGPDSSYISYMAKLNAAGVEMIGYVHTSYGTRDITTVKSEIDTWATQFPDIVGIFLDEAGDTASVLSYYQELYTYIMSMPGWKYDVINPGTVPTSGYASAATQIVTYEDTASGFASSANPSFASCSNKNEFVMISYGGSSSVMQTAINAARSKGYYGWVYVTDGAAGGETYNSLTSYYATEVSYIASNN